MNIEQANAIPLTEILKQFHVEPVKENQKEAWYLCPWRYELTASFHVNKQKNVCFDFGDWIGGDVVKFICILLKAKGDPHSPKEALSVLRQMQFEKSSFSSASLITQRQPKWLITKIEPLEEIGLIRYLEKRGISMEISLKLTT